jgi:hypothetical protein
MFFSLELEELKMWAWEELAAGHRTKASKLYKIYTKYKQKRRNI